MSRTDHQAGARTTPDPDANNHAASDPARMDDIACIDAALGRIRRSMARQSLGRRVLDELGADVDSGLIEVLHAVQRGEADPAGVAVGTVAASLGVDPSQASRLVAEAVKRGYVLRVPAQDDGRRSVLRLSEKGRVLFARFEMHKRVILQDHFHDWSSEDLAAFGRLLTRFSSIARGEDG
ncbi:MarR family transcriptional regulator [Kaistia dalseonensis]|uniref:DNA-binding MarR family transcriptional regulator n=1 Tax=Kaistia dalseonensis TaxID=410840 RepID=A0ABU0H8F9_9HYPH|nr:MarR family transcriptional regulator [Kaistia dalseonensis]MCX5495204.1 MarR family transcriptional regulator [Kaistia dalseonensis]MDQ0437789.1 DNA-binding MarR family transcriptional regulator [Kaistia dalseonensis]